MLRHSDEALKILGGVGLFFSFTEVTGGRVPRFGGLTFWGGRHCSAPPSPRLLQILGVWLAMRYRNQKDPRANPSAFL